MLLARLLRLDEITSVRVPAVERDPRQRAAAPLDTGDGRMRTDTEPCRDHGRFYGVKCRGGLHCAEEFSGDVALRQRRISGSVLPSARRRAM